MAMILLYSQSKFFPARIDRFKQYHMPGFIRALLEICSGQALLHDGECFIDSDMSMRPPRVLTHSLSLIPAPSIAGVPCSYWTLVCAATSSTLHSLSGYHAQWVQLLQASGFLRLPSDPTSQ